MNTINRRIFVSSAAASLATMSVGLRNVGAQPVNGDATFESALTGSVIEILDDAWAYNEDSYAMEEGDSITSEYLSIDNDELGTTAEIEFIQSKLNATQHMARIQGFYEDSWESFKPEASAETDTGAWMAGFATTGDVEFGVYCEYQEGAYEDTDLIVILTSRPTDIVSALAGFQSGVLIGDMEPMLMLAESDAEGDLFTVSATTRSDRTSRGSTKVGDRPDTDKDDPGTDTDTDTDLDADTQDAHAYVLALDDQRLTFLKEFNTFAESLAVFGDEKSTEAEQDAGIDKMIDMANLWVEYPNQQTDVPAPSSLADLEDLYLNWLDAIGGLGQTWLDIIAGTQEVVALFDELDAVDAIDKEFMAALDAAR